MSMDILRLGTKNRRPTLLPQGTCHRSRAVFASLALRSQLRKGAPSHRQTENPVTDKQERLI